VQTLTRGVLLALLAVPMVGGAQTIQRGAVVRVWSCDATLVQRELRVGSVAGDTLLLFDGLNPMQRRMSSLQRVELRVQRTPAQGASHYLAVGFFTGAAIGLGTGIAVMAKGIPCDDRVNECASPVAVGAFFLFSTAGALAGYGLGRVLPGSVWRCVPNAPCGKR
jgi:hypothetical protein